MTHRNEALKIIEYADDDNSENMLYSTGEHKADVLSLAIAHALLEIGDQLRVGNLIALTKFAVEEYGAYAPLGANLPSIFDPPETEHGNMRISPDIARALGIGDDQ